MQVGSSRIQTDELFESALRRISLVSANLNDLQLAFAVTGNDAMADNLRAKASVLRTAEADLRKWRNELGDQHYKQATDALANMLKETLAVSNNE